MAASPRVRPVMVGLLATPAAALACARPETGLRPNPAAVPVHLAGGSCRVPARTAGLRARPAAEPARASGLAPRPVAPQRPRDGPLLLHAERPDTPAP